MCFLNFGPQKLFFFVNALGPSRVKKRDNFRACTFDALSVYAQLERITEKILELIQIHELKSFPFEL